MDFDIIFEDGSVDERRGAACLAALARVRSTQQYRGNPSPVKSVRLFFHALYDDWHEYIMGSPSVMPYIQSYGMTSNGPYGDSYHYYEVDAKVNPHHLMFILGTIRVPYYLHSSLQLWRKLTGSGVHPDVAFYFSSFLFLYCGEVFSRGDVDEYSLQLERYASWEGLKRFVTGVAENKNIPKYFTKRNVMYSTHKTYSRDGKYPVQGWLNGYVKTASNRVYVNRYNIKRTTVVCSLERLTNVLLEVQEHLDLRSVTF